MDTIQNKQIIVNKSIFMNKKNIIRFYSVKTKLLYYEKGIKKQKNQRLSINNIEYYATISLPDI